MECEYFEHLIKYQVAVCKECRHGIIPSQIKNHLQHIHKVRQLQAEIIADSVRSWPGLTEYASEIAVPEHAVPPICQLLEYTDGLKCQLDPTDCHQILRSKEAMRKHWKKRHNWTPAAKKGRPSLSARGRIQTRSQQGLKAVHCQRLFIQGPGSQYFEVQPLSQDREGQTILPVNSDVAWAQVGEEMDKAWEKVKKKATSTIQEGEHNEVNPWLERTQWLPYLVSTLR